MYYIKEVKVEKLDVDKLRDGIWRHEAFWATSPRLVMSHSTRRELICMTDTLVRPILADEKHSEEFMGCPIDINDSLGFGEVLFTSELCV